MWSFSLMAVPFFITMGSLMGSGGISEKLVALANSAVGWMRGGLGMVNVVDSYFFGGISGSAAADTASLGSILIPMMVDQGYDDDFSTALTIASSVEGILVPPSHNMVLYATAAGGISVGNISSFVLYSRKFSGPIHEIAEIWGDLQSAIAAAERVFRILDEEPEVADAPEAVLLENTRGAVELRDITFGYDADKPVLQNFSLQTKPGQLIAIVGPTGAGKTTLINLLMRFYDPQSGEIRVDDKPVLELTRDSLRKAYSMVLQDTWLFYGTIYDNIAYGRPEATREEVIAAAKAAKIHGFIERLPKGYDTLLTDDAANISKGQKQLLTIARAMLMESPMLILDEATSNVDTRTEILVQQAMRKLMENKTCFVVAHRLSTVRNADRILVVRQGNVVESGTHEELMARDGFYRELYQAQWQ
jgi:ATP-binding cassette subfamily B protein